VKLFVAAAGPLGVPVAEELVRACWSIEALYENFQKRVSFPIRPVAHADWALLWSSLPQDDAMLFLIGCPEPANPQGFKDIYALQAGLLPSQAGPDAASWALARGDAKTGVTLYRRGQKPYGGELLFQESCPISDGDDAGTLGEKLKDLAVGVVRQFWELSTKAQLRPLGPVEPGVPSPEWDDGPIPWEKTTREVHNHVRASAHPRRGAYTYLKGRKLTVWKTTIVAPRGEVKRFRPGDVYSYDPFRVWTADGWIKLDRVQWEGEEELPGTEFARTRGIEAGLRLEKSAPAAVAG
jgi:UDP-4-amino-4-deoxy-L-arabinose formyltransferase / UDP-glucuronic acid dehydrogenase (UDP-4-keto-hexauronic acid decarboxylating)